MGEGLGKTGLVRITARSEIKAFLALVKIDMIEFKRYFLDFAGGLISPLFWLASYVLAGLALTGGDPAAFAEWAGTSNFIGYYVLGSVFSSYVYSALFDIGEGLRGMMTSGVFENVYLAPVRHLNLLVSRSFFTIFRTTIQAVISVLVAKAIFNFELLTENLAIVALIMGLTVLTLYGFAFFYAGLVLFLRETTKITRIVSTVTPFLCGFYFSIHILPEPIRLISWALPLTYSIDALRNVLIGSGTLLPLMTEIAILAGMAAAFPFLGYRMYKFIEKLARRRGTLGYF